MEEYICFNRVINLLNQEIVEDVDFDRIQALKDFKELLIKEHNTCRLDNNTRITKPFLEKILNKFNDYQKEDYSNLDKVHFNDCIYYKGLKYDCNGEITCLEHRIESFIKDFEKGKISFDEVE